MTIKRLLIAAAALAYLGFLAVLGASYFIGFKQASAWPPAGQEQAIADKDLPKVEKNVQQLEKRMTGLLPKGLYIVIDTAENRLDLKDGNKVVRSAVVSCGSGVVLEEPGGKKRSWVFDTPRGEFSVKIEDHESLLGQAGLGLHRGRGDHPERAWRTGSRPGRSAITPSASARATSSTAPSTRGCSAGTSPTGASGWGTRTSSAVFKAVSIGTKIYIY